MIQSGSVSFGASSTSSTVTLATPVSTTRAFPRLANVQHAGSGRTAASTSRLNNDDMGAHISGWDGSSFTLNRVSTAESVDHTYYWEVWCDDNPFPALDGWYSRGVKLALFQGGVSSVTIPAFDGVNDWENCIPVPLAVSNESTAREWGEACVSLTMQSDGTVLCERDPSSTGNRTRMSVAVMEFGANWTVSNNLSLSFTVAGGVDSELTGAGAGEWANKLLIPTSRVGSGVHRIDGVSFLVRPKLTVPGTILVSTESSATAVPVNSPTLVCHTASHPRLMVEHQDSKRYSGLRELTGLGHDVDLFGDYEGRDVVTMATAAVPGNLTYPRHLWSQRMSLTRPSVMEQIRSRTSTDKSDHSLQIIEFPHTEIGTGKAITQTATAFSIGMTGTVRVI